MVRYCHIFFIDIRRSMSRITDAIFSRQSSPNCYSLRAKPFLSYPDNIPLFMGWDYCGNAENKCQMDKHL